MLIYLLRLQRFRPPPCTSSAASGRLAIQKPIKTVLGIHPVGGGAHSSGWGGGAFIRKTLPKQRSHSGPNTTGPPCSGGFSAGPAWPCYRVRAGARACVGLVPLGDHAEKRNSTAGFHRESKGYLH